MRVDSGRDDDGAAHHATTHPSLDVGGVEKEIGEVGGVEGTSAKGLEFLVHRRADPRDLGLGDPRVHSQGGDEVVNLSRGDPVIVKPP